jgi:alpha-L-rhamnosidase
MQLAYEIGAATTEDRLNGNNFDVWDSGKVYSDQTIHVEFGRPDLLASGMRVYWKVRTWDSYYGLASAWSTNALFQMGLLNPSDWNGVYWIGQSNGYNGTCPMYRSQSFVLTGEVARATAYVSAKGIYELWINGQRIGQNVLAPEWTDYNQRIQYQTFDVTTNLAWGATTSSNVLGAIVGEGWFSDYGQIGNHAYGSPLPQLGLRLFVQNADGSVTNIVTDASWASFTNGPIRSASIWQGETYDATRPGSTPDWSTPSYADAGTYFRAGVAATNISASQMVVQPSEPIQPVQLVQPVGLWTNTAAGGRFVYIFDMGQNMVGWVRLALKGTTGQVVTLRHAELLELDSNFRVKSNGNINVSSLRGAAQTDTFTLPDNAYHVWEPHFTYHGFRYVEVQVPPTNILDSTSVTGVVLRSRLATSGTFCCSEPKINRLITNILWTQQGNLSGVPTDCPQRDERYGWLGDAQIFSQTACFNMDMASFITKFVRDIRDTQGADGRYQPYAPYNSQWSGIDPGWQGAGMVLPWQAYQSYADVRILKTHFQSATNWVRYGTDNCGPTANPPYIWKSNLLAWTDWLNGDTFGLFTYKGDPNPRSGYPTGWAFWDDTPPDYSFHANCEPATYGTAFFAHSADLASDMAVVLWNDALRANDAASANSYSNSFNYFTELGRNIRSAFTNAQNGIIQYSNNTITKIGFGVQADYAFALYFNMLPDDQRTNAFSLLLSSRYGISNYNNAYIYDPTAVTHLSTGIQGSGRLMSELTRNGRSDLAYALLLDTRFPSWLYMVTNGFTTTWERWNGYVHDTPQGLNGYFNNPFSINFNSFNHYAIGAVGEWIYRNIGGINADDNNPGYENTIIWPRLGGGLTNATTAYGSIRGPVGTAWTWTTNFATTNYTLKVALPANTLGTIYLPTTNLNAITEGGIPATNTGGVLSYQVTNGAALFHVGSGEYHFNTSETY